MKATYRVCTSGFTHRVFTGGLGSGAPPPILQHDQEVYHLSVTSDGQMLATVTGISIDPDKSTDLTKLTNDYLNQQSNKLWLWESGSKRCVHTFRARGLVEAIAFSPDGTLLASAGKSLQIWRVKAGALLRELPCARAVKEVAFSPSSKILAVVDEDGQLTQWSLATGTRQKAWSISHDVPGTLAYTPQGNMILTGGNYDGQLKFWDAKQGTLLRSVRAHANNICSIAVSPDGSRVATGSWDHTGAVWDLRTMRRLFVLNGHSFNVWSITFSPEGSRIATISNEAKIWDAATGRLLQTTPSDGDSIVFVRDAYAFATTEGNRVLIRAVNTR